MALVCAFLYKLQKNFNNVNIARFYKMGLNPRANYISFAGIAHATFWNKNISATEHLSCTVGYMNMVLL